VTDQPSGSVLPPLVIVGPTASGKSSLALRLAEQANANGQAVEIVSADAMAVYAGMDVGTAKPTKVEQQRVRHHLIDVATPADDYTVSRFAIEVDDVLGRLAERGVVPILVGGTGLYVRAVVDQFTIPPKYPEVEQELEREPDTAALYGRLTELDPVAAAKILPTNRRRTIRALEVCIGSGQPFSAHGPGVDRYPPTRYVQVGLEIERAVMDARIDARYDQQMADGFLHEVAGLTEQPLSRTARQALGYKELLDHLDGAMALDEALELARKRTRRFARRQQRWFRRDPRIEWFDAHQPDLVERVGNWWGDQAV
jgi:tRNA dimethylallyltransferase